MVDRERVLGEPAAGRDGRLDLAHDLRGVLWAEDPFAGGEERLVDRDHLGDEAQLPVGVGEVVAGGGCCGGGEPRAADDQRQNDNIGFQKMSGFGGR